METKSRYEVIAELETKKRELIREQNSFADQLKNKERAVKDLERTRDDNTMVLNRKIEDANEGLNHFKDTMTERKETIKELVKSIDESLARFGKLAETK